MQRTRGQALASGLGEVLLTLGLVVLLFCAYELWFTGVHTARAQAVLADELDRSWARPPGAQPAVAPVSRIRIPRLGRDWSWVVVEGVGPEDLRRGPGHYPGSAQPGELGNTVVSGHRTTYGAPFADLLALREGDAVVLETRTAWVTYRVTGRTVVDPGAVEVVAPVPGRPGAVPTRRLLTLTTCHPQYSARERLVVHGTQESVLAKAPGQRPPALDERP